MTRLTQTLGLIFILLAVAGCDQSYDAKQQLTEAEYNKLLLTLAPYVIKKPDEFTYPERFAVSSQPFYKHYNERTGAQVKFYAKTDTAAFFFYKYRDLSSLYEHYQGLGGYFKANEKGDIAFLNILYHTPRLTKEEIEERGKTLFTEMLEQGNVTKYIGNANYVFTPNSDFYYNTKLNRWDYTENSSWKFLEEAKQNAQADSIN